jgi:hypothetical protein
MAKRDLLEGIENIVCTDEDVQVMEAIFAKHSIPEDEVPAVLKLMTKMVLNGVPHNRETAEQCRRNARYLTVIAELIDSSALLSDDQGMPLGGRA